jgi:hypothetical protein
MWRTVLLYALALGLGAALLEWLHYRHAMTTLMKLHADTLAALAEAEARWLEASEAMEQGLAA